MKLTAEQRIAAPRQRVWEALNDPEVLRASIPGCQSLDKVADDRFTATVEVKVGPIGARFKGAVSLTELDAPNGYTLLLEGSGGIAGSVQGSAKVRLSEYPGGTLIAYEVEAQVGGRMAQLGGPIIDATSKQLAGKFFARFGEIVGGGSSAEPAREASDWAGLSIGLLLIVIAGAAFEYGRRVAAPVVVLDTALLRRLIEGAKE
jgi:carbon monoxide dehydrogenase subunit G